MLRHDSLVLEQNFILARISEKMPDNMCLHGWASYAQCDEDGIIRACLSKIAECEPLSNTFVEIGCADGLENNTHQLLLDGFAGVWVDAAEEKISFIKKHLGGASERLWLLRAMVAPACAKTLAQRCSGFLGVASIDFFSLDIDGNDWHALPFFLPVLQPKLICVEYNAKFPPPDLRVMSLDEAHSWQGDDYFGSSLQAWVDLLEKWNYTLVCCNLSGTNAFFVRNDLLEVFTQYPVQQLYQPPRYHLVDIKKGHRASLLWLKQVLQNSKNERARFVPIVLGQEPAEFAIHVDTDHFISEGIAQNGVWEPFESRVFAALCQHGDSVLDLGANIGWYSILAASMVGKSGSVLAFEPDGKNVTLLKMNAAIADRHGVIQIQPYAVGEAESEGFLYKSESNMGDHRLFSDEVSRKKDIVQVTSLDAFFAEQGTVLPDIVKSDTQGSEAKIFKGAKGLLAKGWRPVWILEFWPFGLSRSGDEPIQFFQMLLELDYDLFEICEGASRLVGIDRYDLASRLETDISPSSEGFINILCMPKGSDRFALLANLNADQEAAGENAVCEEAEEGRQHIELKLNSCRGKDFGEGARFDMEKIALYAELEKTRQDLYGMHWVNHNAVLASQAYQKRLEAVYKSTSWQVTAPLRAGKLLLVFVLRYLIAALQWPLAHCMRWVSRRPWAQRRVTALLRHFPGMQSQLRGIAYRYCIAVPKAIAAGEAVLQEEEGGEVRQVHAEAICVDETSLVCELSPGAQRIYRDLRAAVEQHKKGK